MKTEITITINENEIKMEEREARRVWSELNTLFNNTQYIPYPNYEPPVMQPNIPQYPYMTWYATC